MKILVFGSLNIDYTYDVEHIVRQGETITSLGLNVYTGGKGLNQSIALAHAGGDVFLAGCIGKDGENLLTVLKDAGVNTDYIRVDENVRTGNALIQLSKDSDNAILVYAGANRAIRRDDVDRVLLNFDQGDFIVLQNEISQVPYIVDAAFEKGMQVVLNPSPIDSMIWQIDMSKVSCLILNEIEASLILGISDSDDSEKLLAGLRQKYPDMKIVLTLGGKGSIYADAGVTIRQPIYHVKAVDTVAAGDTFLGYFTASAAKGMKAADSMDLAAKASAIAVTRPGAAPSIPMLEEVQQSVLEQ